VSRKERPPIGICNRRVHSLELPLGEGHSLEFSKGKGHFLEWPLLLETPISIGLMRMASPPNFGSSNDFAP